MPGMIVIGADTHKQTHTLVVLDEATGRHLGEITVSSKPEGALDALTWAARLGDDKRVWAIEDVRHVSGRLEHELIRHPQAVIHSTSRFTASRSTKPASVPKHAATSNASRPKARPRREAIRCLKRQITRRVYNLLMHTHNTNANAPTTASVLT
jgi:hypothetical protein